MKNLLAILLIVVGWSVYAQDSSQVPGSRSLFKLAPQNFAQNTLKIGIERFNRNFSKSMVIYLSGMLGDRIEDYDYYAYGYNGLGAEVQYRKYIMPMEFQVGKKDHEYYQGIYFAGFLQGGSYNADRYSAYFTIDQNTGATIKVVNYDYKETVSNVAFGFTLGWHRTLWKVVYVDIYVGGGLQFADITRSGQLPQYGFDSYYLDAPSDPGYQGIIPKFGVHLGIGL